MRRAAVQLVVPLIVSALSVGAAQATPGEVISLHDRAFAINETSIYLLRTTQDNIGHHVLGMSDVFLVEKDIASSQDVKLWPVVRSYQDFHASASLQVRYYPLEGAVNPYVVAAEAGATFLSSDYWRSPKGTGKDRRATLDPGGVSVEGGIGWATALDAEALLAQIAQSVTATVGALQPYPVEDLPKIFVPAQELLSDPSYTVDDCEVSAIATVSKPDFTPVQLVRIACEKDMDPISFIVIVPRA